MKKIFLLLLFSKTIILTQEPIVLSSDWYEVHLNNPIKAITSGAGIYVRLPKGVIQDDDIESLNKKFPKGSIQAKLSDAKGNIYVSSNNGAYAFSKDYFEIILLNENPLPIDIEFKWLSVRSETTLTNVKVVWRNSKR